MSVNQLIYFNKRQWLLSIIGILLIGVFLSPRINETNLRPVQDELYHVKDALAQGELSSINPFDRKFHFNGHPPGYPFTLFTWFKVFPKNYISAKFHALFFSYLALIAFFFFSWQHVSWLLAVGATLILANTPAFYMGTVRNLADIPSLVFLFTSLYFAGKKRWLAASVACLAYVAVRESGIALACAYLVAIALSEEVKGKPDSFKRSTLLALPSLVFLILFYMGCFIFRGSILLHPYASGVLSHTNVSFFSWSSHKTHAFFYFLETFINNIPIVILYTLPVHIYILIKITRLTNREEKTMPILALAITGIFFFIFFSIFGDSLMRDILPTIAAVIFLSFWLTQHIYKKWAWVFFVILALSIPLQTEQTSQRDNSHFMLKISSYLEKHHYGERVCLRWPFGHSPQVVHGYFTDKKALIDDCKSPNVAVVNSLQSKSSQEQRMKLIKKENLTEIKTISSESDNHWFTIYGKKDVN